MGTGAQEAGSGGAGAFACADGAKLGW